MRYSLAWSFCRKFDFGIGSVGLDARMATTAPRYGLVLPTRRARPLERVFCGSRSASYCLEGFAPARQLYSTRFLASLRERAGMERSFFINDEL